MLTVEILCKSLFLTLVLEIFGGYLYGVRNRRDILLLILVNVLTNPAAVSAYYLLKSLISPSVLTVFIEALVILAEGVIYNSRGKKIKKPMMFAALINLFSYFAGAAINMFFI